MTEREAPSGFRSRALSVFRRDWLLYAVTVGFAVGVTLVAALNDATQFVHFLLYPRPALLGTGSAAVVLFTWYVIRLAAQRHPRPLLAVRDKIVDALRRPEEILGFLGVLAATVILISVFSSLKSMIPLLKPYIYDPLFAEWDRALHLGVDPWKLSHGVFRGPAATGFIQFGYNVWFFLFWGMFLFFAIRLRDSKLRLQYLLTHALSWMLIGGVSAVLLSSTGPVYYGRIVGGPDPFAPLMELLQTQDQWMLEAGWPVHVWALEVQERLWQIFEERTTGLGSGISAMPSMHVAIAVLMALAVTRVNRWAGAAFWGFALLIQIGSVHLAWHYAIDGYLAAVMVIAIWKGTGWAVDRHLERAGASPDPPTGRTARIPAGPPPPPR